MVITQAKPEVNFSSNRIRHVSCIKARGLRPRADDRFLFAWKGTKIDKGSMHENIEINAVINIDTFFFA